MQPYSNISCFSTTRHGGCGEGAYATFNCTHYCDDNPAHVKANLEHVKAYLNRAKAGQEKCQHVLIIPRQTHTTNVRVITGLSTDEELQNVDAVVTSLKNTCVCVSTADCVPVLLEARDADGRVLAVAAVHAGWRGTAGGIVVNAVKAFQKDNGCVADGEITAGNKTWKKLLAMA